MCKLATSAIRFPNPSEEMEQTASRNRTFSQAEEHLRRNKKAVSKSQSHVAVLPDKLMTPDSLDLFARNCKTILADWVSLLFKTTPPDGLNSADVRFVQAFRNIDNAITGPGGNKLLSRLAYLQLMRLSDSLEEIVRSEREYGSGRQSGRGDASYVIEIYKKAQEHTGVDAKKLAALFRERRRIGRQWQRLAGPSPLLLLVYSNYAETIV